MLRQFSLFLLSRDIIDSSICRCPHWFISGSKDVLVDGTGLFRDGSVEKRNYLFRHPVYDICLVSQHNAYAIQSNGKKVVNIPILTQGVSLTSI